MSCRPLRILKSRVGRAFCIALVVAAAWVAWLVWPIMPDVRLTIPAIGLNRSWMAAGGIAFVTAGDSRSDKEILTSHAPPTNREYRIHLLPSGRCCCALKDPVHVGGLSFAPDG